MINLLTAFKEERFFTKKSLGQHFLTNRHLLEEITTSLGAKEGDNIVEIGPGCGVLTQHLAETNANIKALEIDNELSEFLKRYLFMYKNLEIINIDALKIDFSSLFPNDNVFITGNLPYNLSVKIFEKTAYVKNIQTAVFMFQKEVAERIAAKPKTKEYSSLSVFSSYYFNIEKIRDIGGGNFFPNAKVMSTVLKFTPKKEKLLDEQHEKDFFSLVRKSFAQKRKILTNNLKDVNNIGEILKKCGFTEKIRAEELSINDFIKLFECIYE